MGAAVKKGLKQRASKQVEIQELNDIQMLRVDRFVGDYSTQEFERLSAETIVTGVELYQSTELARPDSERKIFKVRNKRNVTLYAFSTTTPYIIGVGRGGGRGARPPII